MKRYGSRILAAVCLLALLLSLPVFAFADDGTSAAAQKGLEAIQATGDQKYIQLPKDDSYLEEFRTCYVDFSDVLIPRRVARSILSRWRMVSHPSFCKAVRSASATISAWVMVR